MIDWNYQMSIHWSLQNEYAFDVNVHEIKNSFN